MPRMDRRQWLIGVLLVAGLLAGGWAWLGARRGRDVGRPAKVAERAQEEVEGPAEPAADDLKPTVLHFEFRGKQIQVDKFTPPEGKGKLPAIFVLHGAGGLKRDASAAAGRLAHGGYV